MERYFAELIGVAAAAASLYSAHAKTMVPLRVAAIAGNNLGDGLQAHHDGALQDRCSNCNHRL
jgi:hypothetical protein